MTSHVRLAGTDWALWRPAVLRAPGFPAGGFARLCTPGLAAAADRLAETGPAAYQDAFAAETAALTTAIRDVSQQPRFQLAVGWQNHRVFETAIEPLLRHIERGDRRDGKHRQHEALIANYWQRYCLKNDSIGFFGPCGWVSLDDAAPLTRLRAGREFLASFEVFFEAWAVERLAEVIAAQPGMQAWIPPRIPPFLHFDGEQLSGPGLRPSPLTAAEAAVLGGCTGTATPASIAARLAGSVPGLDGLSDVQDVLAGLAKRRLVNLKLALPLSPHPERDLRRFLAGVGDQALAGAGLAALDRLEAARQDVITAAGEGDPVKLVQVLRGLDDTFVEVTGTAPNRNSGKAYGARTLVYHDARRDIELVLGQDFLNALAPLGLLLHSARWLTWRFASILSEQFTGIADRIAARSAGQVNLAAFWFECLPILHKKAHAILDQLQQEFQQRWAVILDCPEDEARVQRDGDDLRESVLATFDAPRSGWAGARYISPDLLIGAPGVDAINRGEFEVVLGECHLALASIRHNCFVTQHPDATELFDCLAVDNPGPRLLAVPPKEGPGRLTIRTQPALTRDEDFLVALVEQTADEARPRLLRAADLTVERAGDGLVVVVPGGPSFDVLDVFSEMLTNMIMDCFSMFPARPHQPRVSIDRLVVSRETWRFSADQLTFARVKDEAGRYAATRAWWRAQGLPNRVFVKVPCELKPYFVDFDSLVYVELFAKTLRKLQTADDHGASATVQISETLPATDDLWLTDGAGNRYVAELRVVAVDLLGPVPG
jgi:Lantibiotic dehydratase, N terminus